MAVPFQEHQRVWERPSRPGWGAPPGTPAWEVKPWRPLATWWLLGIIGATFILQFVADLIWQARGMPAIGWHGRGFSYGSLLFTVDTDWVWRPWTLITSTLSHGGVFHLLFNGLAIYFFGPGVERLVGRKRYVALFFIGGALSGISQAHLAAWWHLGDPWAAGPGALGASGAIMAIMGILMVLTPRSRITLILVFVPVTLQMWMAGIAYALMDLLGLFNPASNIGHFAHLSGLALGLAYGWWAKEDLKRRGLRVVDPGAPPESPWMRR